jgi:hypothetical protein
VNAAVSARRNLLLGRRYRGRNAEVADFGLELSGRDASARCEPVLGRELKVAFAGPVRQDADEVTEVRLRVEAVQTTVAVAGPKVPRDGLHLESRFTIGR